MLYIRDGPKGIVKTFSIYYQTFSYAVFCNKGHGLTFHISQLAFTNYRMFLKGARAQNIGLKSTYLKI